MTPPDHAKALADALQADLESAEGNEWVLVRAGTLESVVEYLGQPKSSGDLAERAREMTATITDELQHCGSDSLTRDYTHRGSLLFECNEIICEFLALSRAFDSGQKQGGDGDLITRLLARWKECRDAATADGYSNMEQMALGGRAGGLLEAIEMIRSAPSSNAQGSDLVERLREAADALSRAPQPDDWKEKFEAHTKAVHDWISELAETIGAVDVDAETGSLSVETVMENIMNRAREDREKWNAPQPDTVTEKMVEAAVKAFWGEDPLHHNDDTDPMRAALTAALAVKGNK